MSAHNDVSAVTQSDLDELDRAIGIFGRATTETNQDPSDRYDAIKYVRDYLLGLRESMRTIAKTEKVPTLETKIRAQTRIPLIQIAAACHRAKWQFDFNDENRLPVRQARDMVKRAFGELHRIGDMAHKAAEALRSDSAAPSSPAVDGAVAVPKQALDWLFGEGPDNEGKHFGECEDIEIKTPRKYSRRYWWRSKFRSMIPALSVSRPTQGGGK